MMGINFDIATITRAMAIDGCCIGAFVKTIGLESVRLDTNGLIKLREH